MQKQVEAEREKRASILKSEGVRESAINEAEGHRQASILASEAEKQKVDQNLSEKDKRDGTFQLKPVEEF